MARLYYYKGPQAIARAVADHPEGYPIRSTLDLECWIRQTEQQMHKKRELVEATFIINQEGILCLADRHSEHVACASELPQEWNLENDEGI